MDNKQLPTIMVVDDDEDLLSAMTFLLQRYGFQVEARSTAPNWVDLQAIHPALIFMDVELADVNGVFVCKAIKENLTHWNLPVVLTSGHSQEQLEREAHFCHADAILAKPFGSGAMRKLAEHFTCPPRLSGR